MSSPGLTTSEPLCFSGGFTSRARRSCSTTRSLSGKRQLLPLPPLLLFSKSSHQRFRRLCSNVCSHVVCPLLKARGVIYGCY